MRVKSKKRSGKIKVRLKKTKELILSGSSRVKPVAVSEELPKGDKEGYDPMPLIERVVNCGFDASVLSVIDDSDFKLAPNFLKFCLSKDFLGYKPNPRQIQMGLELFADYCPKCSDKRLIHNMFDQPLSEILDRVQLLKYGKCPKCKGTRAEFVKMGLLHYYNDIAACAGQRSGKSVWTASFAAPYVLHRYMKIDNPSAYYNLLPNSTLHMTFVALTYNQAYDALWVPFIDAYNSSEWFKEYNRMLDHYGDKLGVKLYDAKKTFLWYDLKKIAAYPSGPDKRKLRGRTRIFAATDEIGWFDSGRKNKTKLIKFNADEIATALERSLATVRSEAANKRRQGDYNALDAYFVNISSPSTSTDKIMRLVREAKKTTNRVAYHYATWEMNPKITRDDLKDEFRKNPIDAARDYGAAPPIGGEHTFISNPLVIQKSVRKFVHNKVKSSQVSRKDRFGNITQYLSVKFTHSEAERRPHILAVDAGYNNNGFAFVGKYYKKETGKTVTDIVGVATPSESIPINFPAMFTYALWPIVQEFNVKLVLFDQWQSINYTQQFLDKGIKSEVYSLTWRDFSEIKKRVFSGLAILPKPEVPFEEILNPTKPYEELTDGNPVANLIYQLLTVKDIGNKVVKADGVDDAFRAWALSEAYLAVPEFAQEFEKFGTVARSSNPMSLGAVFGRGSASRIFASGGLPGSSSKHSNLGRVLSIRR